MRPATYHACACDHLLEWHGWRYAGCTVPGCDCGAFDFARAVSPDDPAERELFAPVRVRPGPIPSTKLAFASFRVAYAEFKARVLESVSIS